MCKTSRCSATTTTATEAALSQLWSRFKVGDKHAFNQLIRLRYRALFAYATRFTNDRELIQDCLQELMLELWHRRVNIVETSYVTLYLMKALRNNLLRLLRKERQREAVCDEWYVLSECLTDGQTTESEQILTERRRECQHQLQQALKQLPSRQREAVMLKFYEGLSNEAIAEMMAVERQTVANFLYRGLGNLKANLTIQQDS